MKKDDRSLEKITGQAAAKEETNNINPLPVYPPKDDIYNAGKNEQNVDPEDVSKTKSANETENTNNEKEFSEDMSGNDLDIPGTELDDEEENIGSEDEENNYYSLGADNHDDLEEDK